MEKSFKFNLEKVLDIRKEKEEESIRQFKEVQKEKISIENCLNDLKDNYDKYKGVKSGESIIYQKIKRNYLNSVSLGIKNTEKKLRNKIEELETKRLDLNEKRIERKTVETLKDKKFNEFINEQNRVERINNDELALYAFVRNKAI